MVRRTKPGISRFRVRCCASPRNDVVEFAATFTRARQRVLSQLTPSTITSWKRPMSSKKTFLVCHGAWGGGWSWKKMHPLMQAAGHRLVTPTYTGLGERVHLMNSTVDLDTHIEDVVNVIKFEDLRDIVLLGHSYGGMVATGVADRARDRVSQLIYLDAFVPEDGQSLFDLNGSRDQMMKAAAEGDGWRAPPLPTPPDTSKEDAD